MIKGNAGENFYAHITSSYDGGGAIAGMGYSINATDLFEDTVGGARTPAWHMVAITYDGATERVYGDGVLTATIDGKANLGDLAVPLCIGGKENGTGTLNGLIDEVQIYSYALDPISIAQMMANATGETICTGPLPYDFNDDCVVDLADLAEFAAGWLASNQVPPQN